MSTGATRLIRRSAGDLNASPDQMNELLSFGSTGLWLTLLAALGILAGVVFWGFAGKVTTDVSGKGILLNGSVLTIESMGDGQIGSVLIAPGSIVHAGDAVATILAPQRNQQLEAEQSTLADLERQRAAMVAMNSNQSTLQTSSVDDRRSALQVEIHTLEQQRPDLLARQKSEHDLLGKGLVTRSEAQATDQSLATLDSTLAARRAALSDLASERFRSTSTGRMETLSLDASIDASRHRIEALEHDIRRVTTVRSTSDGQVVEVSVRPGMIVHADTTIAEMQALSTQLNAVLYVSATEAKQIHPGMTAQLSPSGIKSEEYGFLRGTVRSISSFPVTGSMLMATLGNEAEIKQLETTGPVHQVEIALDPIASAPGHFQWSSPRGNALTLNAGTATAGMIVVKTDRPANLVIPYLRKTTGVD